MTRKGGFTEAMAAGGTGVLLVALLPLAFAALMLGRMALLAAVPVVLLGVAIAWMTVPGKLGRPLSSGPAGRAS